MVGPRGEACPHKGQRGEYSAGPWQSSARLTAERVCAYSQVVSTARSGALVGGARGRPVVLSIV
eukprot:scaffold1365_cov121-Isochrysis_galbana.AAC.7